VRAGDGKKHGLFRAPAEKTQQKGRQGFEHDGLADDEENGHASISVSMAHFQLMQRFTEEMEDEKEVADDEKGIDDELDEKGSQRLGGLRFHFYHTGVSTYSSALVSLPVAPQGGKTNIHCASGVSF